MLILVHENRVTSTYMFPYKEDLVRFDFEVAPEDEYMWHFLPVKGMNGANSVNGQIENQ